ncbi:MAG: DUF2797 domain-containing protein [Bacteroidia bacterium]
MEFIGNIRKMGVQLSDEVLYSLPLYDVLEAKHTIPFTELVGQPIKISFGGEIHCVVTGKRINKTFGEGMSYDAYLKSPLAVESIIRPELSRIHEGIALRDEEWERAHHLQPHTVYLSLTSDVKVGVTRDTQIPTRWIDQGATQAIRLAQVPYRQLAGLIEVYLKDHFPDKTNWRNMLKHEENTSLFGLLERKQEAIDKLPPELKFYASLNDEVTNINYPVIKYPNKIKSLKLDTTPVIEQKLVGIKGQYLIFDDDSVFNVRAHTAYKVKVEF